MEFEILGQITGEETVLGIPNLKIEAFGLDELLNTEMKLGDEITNHKGYFRILFPMEKVKGKLDHLGIYIMAFNQNHAVVYDGKPHIEFRSVNPHLIELKIAQSVLDKKGKSPQDRMNELMKFAKSP